MSFFERYEKLCLDRGYKPGSERAAQILGTNRGTISAWKTSGRPPKTEYLLAVANAYGVSTDYLLGRTDNPATDAGPRADTADPPSSAPDEDVKKAAAPQGTTASHHERCKAAPKGVMLYEQLDEFDRGKAEGYMQGLLSQDKYGASS